MLLAGLVAVAVFLTLVARFWHPVYGFTRFLQLDASNDDAKIAAFKTQPVYVYRNTGGYDGLYYAQIAYHPALTAAELAPAMDNLVYRARRILPPALAWLFAGGQPEWIAPVYAVLNVGAWLALAVLLWDVLAVGDWRSGLAWGGVLFSVGALGSVRFALTDLVALVIVAAGLRTAELGRRNSATGLLALAGLARETSLLACAGLWERPWFSPKIVGRMLLAAAPLAAWLMYIRWSVGAADAGWSNFDLPFTGFLEKWRADLGASLHPNPDHRLLTWTSLLATCGLTLQAAFILRHRQPADPWWRTGAVYILMMLCLGPAVWAGYPGAATRVLLPLTLVFNVLAARTRAPVAWLVLGNLGVFGGLLMMLDVHHDPHELGAARVGGAGVVAQVSEGWYGVERSGRHTWSWNSGHGTLALETWPHDQRELRLVCSLRSLKPVTVTITQGGALRGREIVGPTPITIDFLVAIDQGHAQLEFSTDTPGTQETADLGGRRLAFAVYDLRFGLPDTSR